MSDKTLLQKIKGKWKETALAVLAFIIIFLAASYSDDTRSQDLSATIGVGHSVINSDLKVGIIGLKYDRWELNARLMEAGETKNGYQEQMETFSASYITEPDISFKGIQPYMRLGASYNTGSELVGNTNFMLGVGVDFHDIWALEFVHDSSAGIHSTNSGVDSVFLKYNAPINFGK
jgi:hypothetical protein